jgi:predicted DnaQ family exonuclease/DinG family helicase
MSGIYVALDIETTGLRPESDTIIEVGAVKFQDDRVIDSFTSLVNPLRPVPRKIQTLTGISAAELEKAPLAASVMPRVSSFIKDYPVVGHNVGFDLGFLQQQNVGVLNPPIDTFELASIILPKMSSYNLELLTKALGLSSPAYHRALADATLAKDLFLSLISRALDLDISTVQEINRAAARSNWPLRFIFQEIEQQKARQGLAGSIREQLAAKGMVGGLPFAEPAREQPLAPSAEKHLLNPEILAALLTEGGPLAKAFPAYEQRPQQVAMLKAVAEAFNNDEHLIVEAGTGVGKSLAYLIPAIAFALRNSRRVVVSTNTITLQDQLYNKDIPDIQRILGAKPGVPSPLGPGEIRVVTLKGRSNYLCTRRWNSFRSAEHRTVDDIRLLARIMIWLPTTLTGDRAELTMPSPAENAAWSHVAAESESCNPETCQANQKGQCFLYRARHSADAAHIIIANHALILSDIATENHVIPEYHHLIVDEAHHLEDAATTQLGYDTDQPAVLALLEQLSGSASGECPAGFLSEIRSHFRGSTVPEAVQDNVQEQIAGMHSAVQRARQTVYEFFNALSAFIKSHGPTSNGPQSGYDQPLRITPGVRRQADWSQVEILWDNLSLQVKQVLDGLNKLQGILTRQEGSQVLSYDDLMADLTSQINYLSELRARGTAIISEPVAGEITWLTVSGRTSEIGLHAAPLHVGEVLEEHLFSQKDCVILTSATMATEGSFTYMRQRLGLDEINELLVGSPFDYKSNALIYLPADLPEPNAPFYQRTMEQTLIALCKATEGRTLVLLTSHSAVRTTYYAIGRPLEEAGISVLGHAIDGTPRQLVERFKNAQHAVLIGTSSLWEGIDVVGDALSVLVIGRLPFSVPSDPIYSARAEVFEDAFNEYAVPQSVIRFKQGFGRLIRSKTDRGVVVILDQRITSKAYGAAFLQSLPLCTVRKGAIADLPDAAKKWLDERPVQRDLGF